MALTNYKTVFKVDFQPTLTFYENLFPVAASLAGYPDWITTGLAVTLQNFEAWCSCTLGHNTFLYIRDIKQEKTRREDERRIRAIIDNVPTRMEIKRCKRVGLRSFYLYPVQMSFKNLVSVISEKFLVQSKEIRESICPKPIDVAYNVHFMDNELRVQLRVGPVKREELEVQLQPDRNSNLPVSKRGLPSEELFAEFPAVSLLIDIDVSKTEVEQIKLWDTYVDAQQVQSKLSENILKFVLGSE